MNVKDLTHFDLFQLYENACNEVKHRKDSKEILETKLITDKSVKDNAELWANAIEFAKGIDCYIMDVEEGVSIISPKHVHLKQWNMLVDLVQVVIG